MDINDLSKSEKALWLSSSLGLAGDYAQTRQIAKRGNEPQKDGSVKHFYEKNPILGKNPSTADINKYFAAMMIGNAAVTQAPKKWRKPIWGALTAAQLAQIMMNKQIGIGFKF